jgi:hypothetical protein
MSTAMRTLVSSIVLSSILAGSYVGAFVPSSSMAAKGAIGISGASHHPPLYHTLSNQHRHQTSLVLHLGVNHDSMKLLTSLNATTIANMEDYRDTLYMDDEKTKKDYYHNEVIETSFREEKGKVSATEAVAQIDCILLRVLAITLEKNDVVEVSV